MLRHSIARVLAICLLAVAPGLVVLPSAAAADPVVEDLITFADVPESSFFYKEISWLAAEGISTGWDTGGGIREYRPLNNIARDAMAAFLYRHAGSPSFVPPQTSPFVDVPAGAAFYKEITWLASKGISTGWDTGGGKREYRPLSPIARDAMAAFLYRYAQPAQFSQPVQSPFTDVAAGDAFYKEITWLSSAGISTGWDTGEGKREYRPLNGIARDAMAAFLYRYASDKVPAYGQDPAGPTVTVAPEVEVLDSIQLTNAQLLPNAVALPSDKANQIHPNDVLVAGVTPGTPEGLLARVVQVVRDSSGTTVIKTEPATLTEAVVSTSGLLEVPGSPVWSTFTPEPDVTEIQTASGASPDHTSQAVAQTEVFSRSMSWKKSFRGQIGSSTLGGDGTLTVDSSVTAAAAARMTLETGFLQLKESSVVLSPTVKAAHSIKAEGDLAGKVSAKLGDLNSGFTFMVGPVPVVVTTQLKISATVTVNGDAEVAFVSSQTVSSDHGFKYRDGSFSLINTKPATQGIENSIEASASLTTKASLDFDATVKFYGMAGITFGVGPYATAAISVTWTGGNSAWTCPAELGVAARLGVIAGIDILGFKLGDWARSITNSWPLYNTNPCEGTPVRSPVDSSSLRITTPTQLPNATVGQDYQASLTAAGGATPYRWSVTSGSLPAGLTLAPATGQISGTPTRTGSNSFTVQVQDGIWALSSKTLTLHVGDGNYGEPLTNVRSIAGGYGNALALKNDGTVFAWGNNNSGQAGDGTMTRRLFPVQVPGLGKVTSVVAASSNGYALKEDGTVWAWGNNNYGQLGDGTTQTRLTPVQVPNLSGIKQIAAGSEAVFAVSTDGTVWAWGYNSSGHIGDGTTTNRLKPVRLPLSNVRMVAAGDYMSTYALKNDGTVWAWGLNNEGQLGNGTTGLQAATPQVVPNLNRVVAIDAGSYTAYALKDDGSVWAWGANYSGALGDGTTSTRTSPTRVQGLTDVQNISVGQYQNAFAKRTDGSIWGWGDNSFGQMFDPFTSPGPNYPASGAPRLLPAEIPALWEVADVYAGMFGSSYALKPDGTAWAWGHNFGGQLGDGTTTNRLTLIAVGVAAEP